MTRRLTIAKVSDIPLNQSRVYPTADRMIAIFNRDGTFHAMDDFCPHMGASLGDGWVEDGCVACPWHAWRFSLSDGSWQDNPKIKVDIYPVTIERGEIVVELPDE